MAYIGLRKPIIAQRTGDGKYSTPFVLGKAISLNVTPNYAEGSLNADDGQAEYDKEFNYADVTLGMILSILVDTFISKISLTMQPGPKIDSISGA